MSWKTYRLGEILERKRVKANIQPNQDYKLITIKLWHNGVTLREMKKGEELKSNMYLVNEGDFVLSGIDARNGAFGIVPKELDDAVVTNDFWCLEPKKHLLRKDFFLFLTSTTFFDYICNQCSDGTTQRIRLQKDKFYDFEISLPPIEDQEDLVKTLKLSQKSNKELSSELTHQLNLVKQLRQAFLREAMQGKLVPQDPNDEPASVLLEKIKAEKESLVKEKKIKKQNPLPPIKEEEIPFEIPKNWVWCRLGEITLYSEGGKSLKGFDTPCHKNGWGVIKTSAITSGQFIEKENKSFSNLKNDHKNIVINIDDLLFCRASGSKGLAGKSCVVRKKPYSNLILSDKSIRYILSKSVFVEFINWYNTSEFGLAYYLGLGTKKSTTMNNVTRPQFDNLQIPLPPLSEQHRIVSKLDDLMHYCDELEASIKESQRQNEMLLQQVLREALEQREILAKA